MAKELSKEFKKKALEAADEAVKSSENKLKLACALDSFVNTIKTTIPEDKIKQAEKEISKNEKAKEKLLKKIKENLEELKLFRDWLYENLK